MNTYAKNCIVGPRTADTAGVRTPKIGAWMPVQPYREPLETSEHRAVSNQGDGKTFVYLASDELGRLLYVGITSDVYRRLGEHAGASAWYGKMAHVATELYPSRQQAARREQQLIERHAPPHNILFQRGAEAYRNMARIAAIKAARVPDLIR